MKNLSTIVIVILLILFFSWLFKRSDAQMDAAGLKWDQCIQVVNEAVPDANDTEGRAAFMQNCYEN